MNDHAGLKLHSAIIKRIFDIVFSSTGLFLTWWIILIAWLISSLETGKNGFFIQQRVGLHGKLFKIIKIRTMQDDASVKTSVTTLYDPRITFFGRIFRKTKIDELPQLINILKGEMSFVGPRPDIPGYADKLEGEDRAILSVRPGITGPASLKYHNEEEILQNQKNPEEYNNNVLFPDKVKINREYVKNYSFSNDIRYIIKTIIKH